MLTRSIPSTGEALPVIGLGTWQRFDVDPDRYPALKSVLATMHASGSRLIDSSPMYGRAEAVIGVITADMPEQNDFFYATKVWTNGSDAGKRQIDNSYRLMKREVLDLVQIHNLVDWKTHLSYLRRLKAEGRLRYIGLTHYLNSYHDELAAIINNEPVDFVQFNYSVLSRHAEKLLLPLCEEKGIATIINRPFGEGTLFSKVAHTPLPAWAVERGVNTWAAFFLKAILAHTAVTCVIPATGNPDHAAQNFAAADGDLPDRELLQRMVAFIESR
jgi:diketogulonate reductase-like aldo/keto reductase